MMIVKSTRTLFGLLLAAFFVPSGGAMASEPTPYLSAQLFSVGGNSYLRGTTHRIYGRIRQCVQSVPGCPSSFERSGLYFLLPPGIHYDSHSAYAPLAPVTCLPTLLTDGREQVVCSGGGLTGGMYNVGQVELIVTVANDAPLGSARAVLGVDDSLPAESNTLAECIDDPLPNYCSEMMLDIGVAPMADLYIDSLWHTPLVFEPDDLTSLVTVSVGNRGNAPSTAVHLQTHLPPGFQWQLATTTTGAFPMTCSKTGNWQNDGETVTCSGGALPADVWTEISLGVRPRDTMEIPGPLPVLSAVSDGVSADPAILLACASDPSPAHCAWHEVPTWVACARSRESGIFCDGFDVTVPVARPAGLEES